MPLQFIRFGDDAPFEAGVWVKAAEVAAWLDDFGCDEPAALMREVEDAPASDTQVWIA